MPTSREERKLPGETTEATALRAQGSACCLLLIPSPRRACLLAIYEDMRPMALMLVALQEGLSGQETVGI